MQKTWSYKNHDVKEGLKPGSSTFRYFFAVSDSGAPKSHYCVWITDDALRRFDPSGDFSAIVASQADAWRRWVKEKIDAGDFRNRALKFDEAGRQEINLSEMAGHVAME